MSRLRIIEPGIGHEGSSHWEHWGEDSNGDLIYASGMTQKQCDTDFEEKLALREIYNARSAREKLAIILDNDGKDLLSGEMNRAIRAIGKILLDE